MYLARSLNNRISKRHTCVRVICNDKQSNIQRLLDQDGSVTIHTRNLQTHSIKMYEIYKDVALKIFVDFFNSRPFTNYSLRYQSGFSRPLVNSVLSGIETISYLRSKWYLVPLEIKGEDSRNQEPKKLFVEAM